MSAAHENIHRIGSHADELCKDFLLANIPLVIAYLWHVHDLAELPGDNVHEIVAAMSKAGISFKACRETVLDMAERRRTA